MKPTDNKYSYNNSNKNNLKPYFIILTILTVIILAGGIYALFFSNILDIKDIAIKHGIIKKTANNHGTILGKIGDINVVQSGLAPDLLNIPAGKEYVYIYKNMSSVLVPKEMNSELDYNLIFINKKIKFDDSSQVNLELLGKNKTFTNKNTFKLDPLALENLKNMLGQAYDEKHKSILITAAYRSVAQQKKLFSEFYTYYKKRIKNPLEKTNERVAEPGYSEHHTGLSADIVSSGATASNFAKTSFYKWMVNNSYKYGFIERYPKGKESITEYRWEPWHFRFVGMPYSKYLTKNKLTMEEFLAKLKTGKPILIEYAAKRYNLIYLKGTEKISVESGIEYKLYKLTASEKLLVIFQ